MRRPLSRRSLFALSVAAPVAIAAASLDALAPVRATIMVTFAEARLLETRVFYVGDIAQAFSCDPSDVDPPAAS